ncbi:peroxisome membrane protein [Zychaea mexicana]|uniref:peroxisome membrane protein n=1 Tax=Zychaea mexicana TaxID=64656 RepID=UPI0022FEB605|nr:peroxisome membrane protein [Zychaea mexicana]KAI9490205.1 peroxisome membrane protein [Zychaea mexicana]
MLHRLLSLDTHSRLELIEDVVRATVFVLPGRFEDAELCAQSILSAVNLLCLRHTHCLVRQQNESLTGFNAHIEQQYLKHKLCRAAALALSTVSYTEVVVEMLVHKTTKSVSRRWRCIASLEGAKVFLRLILFYATRKRMVIHPTHFARADEDDKISLATLDTRIGVPASSTLSRSLPRVGWAHLAELLWIFRPLIYVGLMWRRSKHKKTSESEQTSWKPWLISLGIDLAARLARELQPQTQLEREESKRRDYLLLFYLFRQPFYDFFTKPIVDYFCDATEHRPMISIFAAALNDYRPFWEHYYFCTSGS